MKIEKRLEGKGDLSLIDKLKKMASVEDYKNLLDNFIDGIDVKEDESVTDYLKRNGFKGITDNEVKAGADLLVKTSEQNQPPSGNRVIYKRSDISRMSDAEFMAKEKEIAIAQREGRIIDL